MAKSSGKSGNSKGKSAGKGNGKSRSNGRPGGKNTNNSRSSSKKVRKQTRKSLKHEVEYSDLIILDKDGVLVNMNRAFYEVYKAACRRYGSRYGVKRIPSMPEMLRMHTNKGHVEILMALFPGMTEEEAEGIKAEFQNNPKEYITRYMKILPGTLNLLHYLKKAGKNIAIVSNAKQREVEDSLDILTRKYNSRYGTRYGIDSLFDYIVSQDQAPKKPNPAGILMAINALGSKKALMLDDEQKGVIAVHEAKRRGANIASIASEYHDLNIGDANPNYIVPSTKSFAKLLKPFYKDISRTLAPHTYSPSQSYQKDAGGLEYILKPA